MSEPPKPITEAVDLGKPAATAREGPMGDHSLGLGLLAAVFMLPGAAYVLVLRLLGSVPLWLLPLAGFALVGYFLAVPLMLLVIPHAVHELLTSRGRRQQREYALAALGVLTGLIPAWGCLLSLAL